MADGKTLYYISLLVILEVAGKTNACGQQVIAFQANYISNSELKPGNTLVFSRIMLNIGGGYNSNSGIFTAPQNGNYSFNAHMCLVSGKALGFDVMVGSRVYSSTYARGYTGCGCTSVPAIASLQKNDQVYLRWKTYTHSGRSVICQSIPMSTFTGMLIG